MHLISASRRTDLPAFYTDWFMSRVRSGTASWASPYGGAMRTVSLAAKDVAAIVFWTRNFAPMRRHLDELEGRGHRYVVHFTLTGLPRAYETHVPPARVAVAQMLDLARRIGPERLLWRYDPILVCEDTGWDFHRRNFATLAGALEGATRQCTISFVEIYGKVRRNFEKRELPLPDPVEEERRTFASELAGVADRHGITLQACCSDEILGAGVEKAHCVSGDQIRAIWPELRFEAAAAPTREECGCSRSFDIGAYDSCLHGCIYCYATSDRMAAKRRYEQHCTGCATLLPVSASPR